MRRRRPRRMDGVRARRPRPAAGPDRARDRALVGPAGGGAVAAVQIAKLAGACDFFTALGDDELGHAAARGWRARVTLHTEWFELDAPRADARRQHGERTIMTIGPKLRPRDALPARGLRRGLLRRGRGRGAARRPCGALPRRDSARAAVAARGRRPSRPARRQRERSGRALRAGSTSGVVVLTEGARGGTRRPALHGRAVPGPDRRRLRRRRLVQRHALLRARARRRRRTTRSRSRLARRCCTPRCVTSAARHLRDARAERTITALTTTPGRSPPAALHRRTLLLAGTLLRRSRLQPEHEALRRATSRPRRPDELAGAVGRSRRCSSAAATSDALRGVQALESSRRGSSSPRPDRSRARRPRRSRR